MVRIENASLEPEESISGMIQVIESLEMRGHYAALIKTADELGFDMSYTRALGVWLQSV